YFGQGFNARKLPQSADLERVEKAMLNERLQLATAPSRRGAYRKSDGFALIGRIDPARLRQRCSHAAALFAELALRTAASG
ncbi:MAG TPA: hypothetical protein VGB85_05690, partial [Nannocystis sp.]